jgi:hypothetical protein
VPAVAKKLGASEFDDTGDDLVQDVNPEVAEKKRLGLRFIRKIMWTPELLAVHTSVWKKCTEETIEGQALKLLFVQEKTSSFVTIRADVDLSSGFVIDRPQQAAIAAFIKEYDNLRERFADLRVYDGGLKYRTAPAVDDGSGGRFGIASVAAEAAAAGAAKAKAKAKAAAGAVAAGASGMVAKAVQGTASTALSALDYLRGSMARGDGDDGDDGDDDVVSVPAPVRSGGQGRGGVPIVDDDDGEELGSAPPAAPPNPTTLAAIRKTHEENFNFPANQGTNPTKFRNEIEHNPSLMALTPNDWYQFAFGTGLNQDDYAKFYVDDHRRSERRPLVHFISKKGKEDKPPTLILERMDGSQRFVKWWYNNVISKL